MGDLLLIYSRLNTRRFQYTLQWIFAEQMDIEWQVTDDKTFWDTYQGPKINYSDERTNTDQLHIKPTGLLGGKDIEQQQLLINRWKHSTILFYNQPGAIIPFDLFSAVFFLISRYEEYLPHKVDKHGRYDWRESVAGRFSFLQQPVVDEWIMHLGNVLNEKFLLPVKRKIFRFRPTYDIDMAWRYLHKGISRTIANYGVDILKFNISEIRNRNAVMAGRVEDPFFCFDKLDELHKKYELEPLFFLLLGKYGKFDRNTEPEHPAMQRLIKRLAKEYAIGIHPSYGSHTMPRRLEVEINILTETTGNNIAKSRQHFIKFTLPHTYRLLAAAGIKDEYSMGYASANGFRAGTSNSFLWYDLEKEVISGLRVHPFVFMDATSKFYNKSNLQDVYLEWERLYYSVLKVKGTFVAIWHNYILSDYREYKGWLPLYEKCLALVAGGSAP